MKRNKHVAGRTRKTSYEPRKYAMIISSMAKASRVAIMLAIRRCGPDPPLGLWRHGGLINEFCRGRWATPILLPTALAGMRKRLEALYRLRVVVDYEAELVSKAEAKLGLEVIGELLQLVAHNTGWAL